MRRRHFLRGSGQLGVSLACLDLVGCSPAPLPSPTSTPAASGYDYKVAAWTGDSFAPMHLIRDGFKADLPRPEKKVKLVVIGAGLSGLTLAYNCKDLDLLVLEREPLPGGNAKSENYKGIEYALGSAYLVDVESPYIDLYKAIGMDMKPIAQPAESVWTPNGFVQVEKGPLQKTVERIQEEMRGLLPSPDYPHIPIQKASARALKLDDISYYDWLQKNYADYVPMADEYCWTALGGDSKKISAYIGVNGLSELVMDIYAFPGGNAAVAKKLAVAVGPERIMTGQSVFRVEPSKSGVKVGYFATDSGLKPEVRCVEAEQVVLACPFYFGARLMPWAEPSVIKSMRSLEYGSYMVVNLCFEGKVFHQGYDHWCPGQTAWADFVDADYAAGNPVADASVITVYAPFRNIVEGRALLLAGDGENLCRKVVEDVQMRTGFPKEKLKEVRLTRYGHQLFCSRQGVIRQMLALPRHFGRVHLCHSDGQGCASIESAISEAFAVAPVVKKALKV